MHLVACDRPACSRGSCWALCPEHQPLHLARSVIPCSSVPVHSAASFWPTSRPCSLPGLVSLQRPLANWWADRLPLCDRLDQLSHGERQAVLLAEKKLVPRRVADCHLVGPVPLLIRSATVPLPVVQAAPRLVGLHRHLASSRCPRAVHQATGRARSGLCYQPSSSGLAGLVLQLLEEAGVLHSHAARWTSRAVARSWRCLGAAGARPLRPACACPAPLAVEHPGWLHHFLVGHLQRSSREPSRTGTAVAGSSPRRAQAAALCLCCRSSSSARVLVLGAAGRPGAGPARSKDRLSEGSGSARLHQLCACGS